MDFSGSKVSRMSEDWRTTADGLLLAERVARKGQVLSAKVFPVFQLMVIEGRG